MEKPKTEFADLYEWDKKDTKLETIEQMAINAEKADALLKTHNDQLTTLGNTVTTHSTDIAKLKTDVAGIGDATANAVNAAYVANEAGNAANSAAASANTSATEAQTNADYALQQGNYAKAKGDFIASKEDKINQFTNDQTNLQAQINNLVIKGDSSPAAAQAAVDAKGVTKASLKQRLDDDYNKLSADLAQNASQLADNAISPEKFTGNDLSKLQQALDYALINKVSIRLAKMYDITSLGAIKLNKTLATDRTPIYFIGVGGGIKKTDSGYIFTSDTADVGDMTFSNVRFEGVAGGGAIVFDCNKLIRINSQNCAYRNIDGIVYVGDTRQYIQSMRFMGDTIVGGNGFAFDFIGAYDFSLTNILMEGRDSGVRQRYLGTSGNRFLYNTRIRDCALEGLSGTALSLSHAENLIIDGVYFEKNIGGNIVFNGSSILNVVTIMNCRSYGSGGDTNPLIKWGGQTLNCKSFSNLAYNTAVHDTTNVATNNYIQSDNDTSGSSTANIIGAFNPIIALSSNPSNVYKTLGNGDKATFLGSIKRLYKESTSVTLAASEKKMVQVQFSETITQDSSISLQMWVSSNLNVNILYVQRDTTDKTKVNIYLQNTESTSTTVQFIAVTVLKPFYSTTG